MGPARLAEITTSELTVSSTLTATDRIRTAPWWLKVLVIYGLSRLVTTALMFAAFVAASNRGGDLPNNPKVTNFFTFSSSWDSAFFQAIQRDGYPLQIPVDADGHVEQNLWAFLPAYPWATGAVMKVTGLEFPTAGVVLALIFGAGATLALYRMLVGRVGEKSALWAAILFSFGPMSFLFQVAYSESMYLFFLFAALAAMVERRYLLMIPFAVIAAFTRPGILAVALALGIVFLIRFFRKQDFPLGEKVRMIIAGLVIAAAGLAWPQIATAVTGFPDAYVQTELSWWVGWVGRVDLVFFAPSFLIATKYLGAAGIVLVLVVIGLFVWWLTRRRTRALGPEILLYAGGYALYLFAVFLPQVSFFRIALLPLSPLLGDPAIARSRMLQQVLLVGSVVLQSVAITFLWFLKYP